MFIYLAHDLDKPEIIGRILQAEDAGKMIVFTRTKRAAQRVADDLAERGFSTSALHGDMAQVAREKALTKFREDKLQVLVATDVAARGIDIDDVTHVVNYQCPEDEKTYVHRIGRTGRAGNTGIAVTFVDWDDIPRWGLINKALDLGIPEPEETYSSYDHLYSELDIPREAKGRLPKSEQKRAGLEAEELEDLGETGKGAGRKGPGRSGQGGTGGRGGRSGGAGRSSERPQPSTGEGETKPRRSRNRRRTRGGEPAGEASQG